MKNICLIICLLLLGVTGQELRGQNSLGAIPNPDLMKTRWRAGWITCPNMSLNEYTVLFFRKTFDLEKQPSSFIVNVSGDTRYRFYVNGQSVCFGPSKGDRYHWYFETVDIASLLKGGSNTLSAVVWNFGERTPVAQMSSKTGFIVKVAVFVPENLAAVSLLLSFHH